MTFGKTTAATGADPTKSFDFRYRVVPLASLVASHDAALAVNPKFPKEIQPRIRSREASRQQIKRIASQLKPDALLTDVKTLDRGPMIVGPDLVVESGNGRTIALKIAALEFPDKLAAYNAELTKRAAEFGVKPADLTSIENPVLVRERTTKVDRVEFAARANEAQTLTMSPLEQALQDAGRLEDTDLAALKVNDLQSIDAALKTAQNRPLVSKFLKGLSDNEQAALVGANGELNILGLQRIKAAMFAKVYPGEAGQRLTQAFFESIDPTVKNVENALFDSLPQMAQAEGLARSGQRDRDLSLANDTAKAVDMLARLKQQGMSVEDFLSQKGMFERELNPTQEKLLAFLAENGRSRKRIREFMRTYADGVMAAPHPQQGAMFKTATESKIQMVDRLIGKQEKEAMGQNVGLFALLETKEKAKEFSGPPAKESAPAATGGKKLEGPGGRGKPAAATPAGPAVTTPPKPKPEPKPRKVLGKTISAGGQRIAQITEPKEGRFHPVFFESRLTGIPQWMIKAQADAEFGNQQDAEVLVRRIIKDAKTSPIIPYEFVLRANRENLSDMFGLAQTAGRSGELENKRALQLHRQLKDIADDRGVTRQHEYSKTLAEIEGRLDDQHFVKLGKRATTFRTIKGKRFPESQAKTPKGLRSKLFEGVGPRPTPKPAAKPAPQPAQGTRPGRRTTRKPSAATGRKFKPQTPRRESLTRVFEDPNYKAIPGKRNPELDMGRRASRVAPATANNKAELRLQKQWLAHPNRLDFEGIDDTPMPKPKAFTRRRGL